jgi:FkbM family methyltransferase
MSASAGATSSPMADVLAWLSTRESFSIVQIGAYIGDTGNDPLYVFLQQALPARPRDTVVLVEPVAEYFHELQKAYASLPRVRLERIAIAEADGERAFYRLGVDPTLYGDPDWLAQLGSLHPTRMTHMWDRYERGVMEASGVTADLQTFWLDHRIVEHVHCTTLHHLLTRHSITELDLLQIDAEGYDYEILRTIDFTRIQPRFINYERVLLDNDEPACRAMLIDAGYVLFDWGQDTLCIAVA